MRIRRRATPDYPPPPVELLAGAAEVLHAAPVGGFSFTPCCDRTPQELPPYDRITRRPEEVTCGRLSETDELLLSGAPVATRRQNTEQLLFDMAVSVRTLRGPRLDLQQALQYVQAAVRELAPARHAEEHWPASLLVQITTRAVELAG
jgi:hypothetical protein